MATLAQVRDRAANDLGVLALNQTLAAQDSTRITSGYNEVYAQLKRDGLACWALDGDVPDEFVSHVANLVADNCLTTYGVSVERYNIIKNSIPNSVREIRKFASNEYVSMDDGVDY